MKNCSRFWVLAVLVFTDTSMLRADSFEQGIQPLLNEYCVTCHSTEKQKGELDLEQFSTVASIKNNSPVWQNVLDQLANSEMPPKDEPQMSAEQRNRLSTWVQATLDEVALANSGDPGPVVLRRLSNMEYSYTIRDLTGVDSLDPAKEFPIDGAAGEGFTNAGAALVMSPALLTKYLDAAKEMANHMVLLPDGIRFSPSTSSRDWTDETLAKIREFYARYSESSGATSVNLQGIQFDTNAGGRLPIEKYLLALLKEREPIRLGKPFSVLAAKHGLNQKYLATLSHALNDSKLSLVLDGIRERFHAATADDADQVAKLIRDWQQSLWRFASVGHIGKVNGPRGWQEPVTPLVSQNEMRVKLASPSNGSDVTLYLTTFDAGDGNESDFALWENARIVAPGLADLQLKDVRSVVQQLEGRREEIIASVTQCLAAAHEAENAIERIDIAKLAEKHSVAPELLGSWLDYLGIRPTGEVKLGPLLTQKVESTPDYNFIKGWAGEQALSVLANSSDNEVRIPGIMKPHSVGTHPSPTLASVIAWRSPVTGSLRISGSVQDAHLDCGNGVTWSLELRRGNTRDVLASGATKDGIPIDITRSDAIAVSPGDVIALVIGPRDGNHVCDFTAVDLFLSDGVNEWSLAKDISPNILDGNPHADRQGNKDVWYFFGESESTESAPLIPVGSLLSTWRRVKDARERDQLAKQIQDLLKQGIAAVDDGSPNRPLVQQLLSFNGPLLRKALRSANGQDDQIAVGKTSQYGLDPALFGKHPTGTAVAATSLCVKAPAVIEVTLPASLIEGAELVVTGRLDSSSGTEGSVQLQVLTTKPDQISGIAASKSESAIATGKWSDNNLRTLYSDPIIVNDGSEARRRMEAAFDEFRNLFPIALCYTKIVPVDEVVTLTLFYREDDYLKNLMLDETEIKILDRLWDQLRFVSESPLKQVDVFEQLYQYATQDADPSAFESMREPIMQKAAAFTKNLVEVEPFHQAAVLDFATQAWRRPLTTGELSELHLLYQELRKQELPHSLAVRMLVTRVLVSPAFLYRGERAMPGPKAMAINDWELATRLSYFLWSSTPDVELRSLANAGKLHEPEVLRQQTQRMLKHAKIRRLATEFGCQWLHVRDLETLDEKSERHFPTFVALRSDMQEEVVRFFLDLFQENRSVVSLLDADHSFMNGALARHYGIELKSEDWQRVEGLRAKGRGGMLAFAGTLAKQSGASRTSPILRGNWLSEVILGEKLPRPPKGVPVLPDETPSGLTERQLIERHSSDIRCAKCHQRIDPFGFALEGFDAIGRVRTTDAGGLSIDTRTSLTNHQPPGDQSVALEGLDGLRSYLVTTRSDDFVRQFCRKLLGYSLGRSVQLSDKPLIESMLTQLKSDDHRVATAIELIVLSPQFRELRGRDYLTHP